MVSLRDARTKAKTTQLITLKRIYLSFPLSISAVLKLPIKVLVKVESFFFFFSFPTLKFVTNRFTCRTHVKLYSCSISHIRYRSFTHKRTYIEQRTSIDYMKYSKKRATIHATIWCLMMTTTICGVLASMPMLLAILALCSSA